MKPNRQSVLIMAAGVFASASAVHAQDQVTHVTAADGSQATLTSGQPKPDQHVSPPSFAQLDTNRDGFISREEAEAYTPLLNDFDHLASHANRVSKAQFDSWVQTKGR